MTFLGQAFGRDGTKCKPPPISEGVDAEGTDLVHLGFDRSGIRYPLIHDQALLRSAVAGPVLRWAMR